MGTDPGDAPECAPTVFVVDDDACTRDALRSLLESVGLAVETFAMAEEFLAAYDPGRCGCLVLDLRLPGMSGLSLQAELAARRFHLPVIVLTGVAAVRSAVSAIKAGAVGFFEKPCSEQMFLDHVRYALALDREARRTRAERAAVLDRAASLTARERDVMRHVVAGKPNRRIAAELGISRRTVEVHRAQVMNKMKAASLAHLVRLALLSAPDADFLRPPQTPPAAARRRSLRRSTQGRSRRRRNRGAAADAVARPGGSRPRRAPPPPG